MLPHRKAWVMNDKLKEGLNVVSSDGDPVDKIENVYLYTDENRSIFITLSKNENANTVQLIPAKYVYKILENKVLLSAEVSAIECLPSFKS
jgi:uncharacterized protein YrrD